MSVGVVGDASARVRTAPPPVPAGRRVALDGLRGCAVLGVVLAHARVPFLQGGAIGVNVFFVLSGYLITGLLVDEFDRSGRLRLSGFWRRRAARLLPALGVLIVLNTAYALTTGDAHRARETFAAVPWVLGYVGNWRKALTPHDLGVYGHTWSLAVEEQFYLLWPLVVAVWARATRRRDLVAVLAVACAGGTLLRYVLWPGFAHLDRIHGTDYQLDQVLIGALLAVAVRWYGAAFRAALARVAGRLAGGAVVVLLAIAVLLRPARPDAALAAFCVVGFTVVAVAAALVIAHVDLSPRSRIARTLSFRPLVGLGRVSYGVYLLHIPVFAVAEERLHLPFAERLAVELAVALGIAVLSYVLLERRFLARSARYSGVTKPNAVSGAGWPVPVSP